MNTSKVLNLLLAIVLVILCIKIAFDTNESPSPSDSPSILDVIATRTSVRAYQQQAVEEEKVEQLLRAAMAAPSAVNKQPWAFIVVREKETLEKLAATLPYAKMTAEAPLAIVVFGDLTKALEGEAADYWIQDASAATENLLLAAHGLGLGAVWTGLYPIPDRVESVQQILRLPQYIVPLNVIPIGYPAETPAIKDKWKPGNIHYEYWGED